MGRVLAKSGRPESAVAVAVAVARDLGLRCDEPLVLRDAWHVLVHLRPLPIVARVSSSIPFPEGPKSDDVIRELDVVRHAVSAGAPVIPPVDEVDPGPHHRGGRVVTLWRYVPPQGEVDPRSAGRRLRSIHEALRDYDGELPAYGHPGDTSEMLDAAEPSADVELLREIASRRIRMQGQALHGDAHLANCLPSGSGPLWHDFETACHGPPEYDLAALVMRDRMEGGEPAAREALTAYGPHDADLLDQLLPIYAAWIYASFLLALPRRPERAAVLREGLNWLRQGAEA
jgi:phosphotransferase family enzyme